MRKDNYRDLQKYRETRKKQRKRYYNKTSYLYEGRRWTPEEDDMVMAHISSDTVLSERLHRSVQAIQRRRWMLKKKKMACETVCYANNRLWTSEEDDMIAAHTVPDAVLSDQIQRSIRAIQLRRWSLKKAGREIKDGRRHWTETEDALVFAHDITDTQLSEKIHRSTNAIRQRRSLLKKKAGEKNIHQGRQLT